MIYWSADKCASYQTTSASIEKEDKAIIAEDRGRSNPCMETENKVIIDGDRRCSLVDAEDDHWWRQKIESSLMETEDDHWWRLNMIIDRDRR